VANPTAISRAQVSAWEAEGLVRYLGSSADVRPFIAQAHCVVLPSYREGVPRALLEAASMGRPLLATDVVGCRDAVDDGVNGMLAPARDAARLAAKMEQMARLEHSQLQSMGRSGRAKVESEFDERAVIDQYLALFAPLRKRVP
jgi:glycosyltransferase involved in cell wall biosynthesis